MSAQTSIYNLIVAVFLAVVMFSIPSVAQEADSQDPGELMARLATSDASEAIKIDRQLQAIWSKSGSATMDLLLKRGVDALEVDDVTAAIEHLTALTDHAPDFAEGFHQRASAYFRAELFGPAFWDLERALRLNPDNYNALFGLGALLETFNEKDRAYDAYGRVLELHPHHKDAKQARKRLERDVAGRTL